MTINDMVRACKLVADRARITQNLYPNPFTRIDVPSHAVVLLQGVVDQMQVVGQRIEVQALEFCKDVPAGTYAVYKVRDSANKLITPRRLKRSDFLRYDQYAAHIRSLNATIVIDCVSVEVQ
jgi:hypothetical protein